MNKRGADLDELPHCFLFCADIMIPTGTAVPDHEGCNVQLHTLV